MRQLSFKVISDINQAQDVWDELSPHRSLDDEWDFRYSFTKYLHYTLHFIAGYDNGELVGLLPLQYNASYGLMPPYAPRISGFLEFFGGDDTDSNDLFLKKGYEEYREQFFSYIDRPAILAPLSEAYEDKLYTDNYTFKYVLSLTGYKTYEDFLQHKFSGSSRQTMRRQIRQLYAEHKIEVIEGEKKDLEVFFDMSLNRFGDDSSFRYEYRKQIFRDLYDLYDSSILTILVNGKKEAVAFNILHKGVFSDINAVANPEIPNLGKLLSLLQINKAIEKGAYQFDAGKGDSGWKERFHLQRVPQYVLNVQKFQQLQTPRFFSVS